MNIWVLVALVDLVWYDVCRCDMLLVLPRLPVVVVALIVKISTSTSECPSCVLNAIDSLTRFRCCPHCWQT